MSAPTEGAPSEDADEDEGNLVIDDTKVGGGIVICRLMVASYGPTDNNTFGSVDPYDGRVR